MRLKDVPLAGPAEHILYDEVLLALAERGAAGECLRIWESPVPFVVLGRTGRVDQELIAGAVGRDRIPVLRRSSGGGTVLQGPGCLNYSLVLSKQRDPALNDIRRSYQYILEQIVAVLGAMDLRAAVRPISDLVIEPGERKFSGNAQRRSRNFILHHGTILYQFDLDLITRYLLMPADVPEYRRGRAHRDFVTNIPLSPQVFAAALSRHFAVSGADTAVSESEAGLLQRWRRERGPLLRAEAPGAGPARDK